jgi:hypothetical protein
VLKKNDPLAPINKMTATSDSESAIQAVTKDGTRQSEGEATKTAYMESTINLALLDPPRWGWTVAGGIADVLPPHERARRKSSKRAFLQMKRKRSRNEASAGTSSFAKKQAIDGAEDTGRSSKQIISTVISASSSSPRHESMDALTAKGEEAASKFTTFPAESLIATTKEILYGQEEKQNVDKGTTAEQTHASVDTINETMIPRRFSALCNDSASEVDIYTYHRGREGFEMRVEETGELMCDMEPTDTNYTWDEPKLVAHVTISFAVEDAFDDLNSVQLGNEIGDQRYFREKISWDLTDPETPTPLAFATEVAENFGLSFGQTLDLENSIQRQLHSFVKENCSYAIPTATKETFGQVREATSSATIPTLYGQVNGFRSGGLRLRGVHKARPPLRTSSIIGRGSTLVFNEKGGVGKCPTRDRASETKVEQIYVDEVRQRLRQYLERQVREQSSKQTDDAATVTNKTYEGQSVLLGESICHLCDEEKPECVRFACGVNGHSYCAHHFEENMPFPISEWMELKQVYCPICSLTCTCSICKQTVASVAAELKQRTLDQDLSVDMTVFDDILQVVEESCLDVKSRLQRKIRGRVNGRRPKVGKIPLSDFPREVCNGVDLDPGSMLDYRTVYTPNGFFLIDQVTSVDDFGEIMPKENVATSAASLIEDGSVDYCNVCRNHGNLLCCDYCPRAFHSECIHVKDEELDSEAPWECPVCLKEKKGLPSDKISGSKSLALICAAYDDLGCNVGGKSIENLRTLSIVHEMVIQLIDYDFGFIFGQPVDSIAVPTYCDIVENPIDLGTIASRLINGSYKGRLGERKGSLEDTVLAVLKDIELVWHNCFIFNCEGSAVYRMAEVQRRRSHNIRRESFSNKLTDYVRTELENFILSCKRHRLINAKGKPARNKISSSEQGRHKISVAGRSSNGRLIAVLDPDTGQVVKIYSTEQAAILAVQLFLKMKHAHEWDDLCNDVSQRVRNIIKRSTNEPNALLFGYRWLYFDELKENKVTLGEISACELPVKARPTPLDDPILKLNQQTAPLDIIELRYKSHSFTFLSVEQALSHVGGTFPPPDSLRERFVKLYPGEKFVDDSGGTWHRLLIRKGFNQNPQEMVSDHVFLPQSVAFIKVDLASGRTLVGFHSIASAYEDWLLTIEHSPVVQAKEDKTLKSFASSFINGDRHVAGLVWKRRKNLVDRNVKIDLSGFSKSENDDPTEDSKPSTENPLEVSKKTNGGQILDNIGIELFSGHSLSPIVSQNEDKAKPSPLKADVDTTNSTND